MAEGEYSQPFSQPTPINPSGAHGSSSSAICCVMSSIPISMERRSRRGGGCEAAGRPGQRFVPVRSVENQAALMHHRARELMVGQRTAALNALRGHLSEIVVVAAQGFRAAMPSSGWPATASTTAARLAVPDCVRLALLPLVRQIDALDEELMRLKRTTGSLRRPPRLTRPRGG